MIIDLRQGEQPLRISVPEEKLFGHFQGPSQTNGDLSEKVRKALEEPISLPPVNRAVTPSDHVALIVASDLPQPRELVGPIIDSLVAAGIERPKIAIVHEPPEKATSTRLVEELRGAFAELSFIEHDPTDDDAHAYVASTEEGRRIYLNRTVAEADFMLVISRTGFDPLTGTMGTSSQLFPRLSNAETIARARMLAAQMRRSEMRLRKRQESEEVAWLAGLLYALQVDTDSSGKISHVWFGEYHEVQKCADQATFDHWMIDPPEATSDLVIATTSTPGADWLAASTALETASHVASRDAIVLLITDLDQPIGQTGAWLLDNENPMDAIGRVRQQDLGQVSADSLSTVQTATALTSARLYLMSSLDEDLVESLGMVHVSNEREVNRLIERSRSCYVIENADRARVTLGN
ncbi:hypothetical protein Pan216_34550 [Planctomycetes bacterium Pan216]|uniref:LarA-like N-terminal domain-containing protein n=1 Tax=Kolteria novifilia TaxID=2527975 RepID=A0A518B6J1_9BACT|nr:hypothetical protein Pan216_34550 [Planctomycetes bacterium Pan216]